MADWKIGRAKIAVDPSGKNEIANMEWVETIACKLDDSPIAATSLHALGENGWSVMHLPSGFSMHRGIHDLFDAKAIALLYMEKCSDNEGYRSEDPRKAREAFRAVRKEAVELERELRGD